MLRHFVWFGVGVDACAPDALLRRVSLRVQKIDPNAPVKKKRHWAAKESKEL